MAYTINVQTYIDAIAKLSNAEQLALQNIIWTDAINGKDFSKTHNIKTGIRFGDLIPFGQKGDGFTFMNSTTGRDSQCDEVECDISTTLSTKKWEPGRYDCKVEFCAKDVNQTVADYFKSDLCTATEMSESVFIDFLRDLIAGKIDDSLWVKTYFGEKASGATYLNGNDGFYVQALALAPSGDEKRIEIPENALSTYALQKALDPERGYKVFSELVEKFEENTGGDKKGVIRTTKSLALNYLKWLRDQKQVICCEKDPLTATYTIDNLTMFGYKIEVEGVIDRIIKILPETNDGTKWDNPHRAFLIAEEDWAIGTCEEGQFAGDPKFKVDDYNNKFKFTPEYTLDVKILNDNDFVLAI